MDTLLRPCSEAAFTTLDGGQKLRRAGCTLLTGDAATAFRLASCPCSAAVTNRKVLPPLLPAVAGCHPLACCALLGSAGWVLAAFCVGHVSTPLS